MKWILLAVWLMIWILSCRFTKTNKVFFSEHSYLVLTLGAVLGIINLVIWSK